MVKTWARHKNTETVLNNGWQLAAVGGWRLADWRLVAVCSCRFVAVGGWRSLGAVLKCCPEQKNIGVLQDSPGSPLPRASTAALRARQPQQRGGQAFCEVFRMTSCGGGRPRPRHTQSPLGVLCPSDGSPCRLLATLLKLLGPMKPTLPLMLGLWGGGCRGWGGGMNAPGPNMKGFWACRGGAMKGMPMPMPMPMPVRLVVLRRGPSPWGKKPAPLMCGVSPATPGGWPGAGTWGPDIAAAKPARVTLLLRWEWLRWPLGGGWGGGCRAVLVGWGGGGLKSAIGCGSCCGPGSGVVGGGRCCIGGSGVRVGRRDVCVPEVRRVCVLMSRKGAVAGVLGLKGWESAWG